ncbi:MAG: hypothetical protein GWN29_07225 [Gammaproteobacteria bacterium]|nr:hypothetical protein [Gammaproteobacteria bacterium]
MCLVTFALGSSAAYPLVFAANRDELHARPTATADWWSEPDSILGGRDLLAGGSWLAVDRRGRLAAVTNIPSDDVRDDARSRGALVRDFLIGEASAADFVATVASEIDAYRPFNFLAFDGRELHFAGSADRALRFEPGIHALSNAPLGADWPKIHEAQAGLAEHLEAEGLERSLFSLLARGADDAQGPKDRLSRRERIFVRDGRFGTRSSTIVFLSADGQVRFVERNFTDTGELDGERVHEYAIET